MDGMSAFMHDGSHIAHRRGGVHKDERDTDFRQRIIIATWRLSFAGFEIEVSHFIHDGQTLTEIRVKFPECLD